MKKVIKSLIKLKVLPKDHCRRGEKLTTCINRDNY